MERTKIIILIIGIIVVGAVLYLAWSGNSAGQATGITGEGDGEIDLVTAYCVCNCGSAGLGHVECRVNVQIPSNGSCSALNGASCSCDGTGWYTASGCSMVIPPEPKQEPKQKPN